MALQFYFGGSGAGKSRKLHEDIIAASIKEPERSFFLIVPEQFTMQSQMDLVLEHPNHGIMNIDVLSFGRLAHRILEEVGGGDKTVLDDTGKSLILRKIAQSEQSSLSVIGKQLHKTGYINEVKSVISEFMQYGIGVDELKEIELGAKGRGALYYKLKDLELLYGSFLSYIKEKYITTEETLDALCMALPESKLIKNCVIAFDGFTGFTPVQNRVIGELLKLAERVIVTVTIDEREDPYHMDGEQKLFYLSKKTVRNLKSLSDEAGAGMLEAVVCPERKGEKLPRFLSPELAQLERNLFRYPFKPYNGEIEHIHLSEASAPREEVRQICIEICRLLGREEAGGVPDGLHYRDIAVVTGSMEVYENYIQEEFAKFGIPVYMDRTRGILYNPFTEYIRSALQLILQDFSREAVFHYLRTGLCGFEKTEIDRLENYVISFGIRGRGRFSEPFVYKEEEGDEGAKKLAALNRIREKFMKQLEPLPEKSGSAKELVRGLYEFLVQNELQLKLARYEKEFEAKKDLTKANEYRQIYALVIDLLDKIARLLGEEEMELQEFADILDAGFSEISVGTIPQNVDRILVGDIERTRLKQVRVLFFIGINDGSIPKESGRGGIISDIDREFIKEEGWELAPTPRQRMYTQRFYLYLNMTKPSDELYLSYVRLGGDGKSRRPSYLIDTVKRLFPELKLKYPENFPIDEQMSREKDGLRLFADLLREYAAGRLDGEEEKKLYTLYHIYNEDGAYKEQTDKLVEAAFYSYQENSLSKEVTRLLYGSVLQNSISRLEKYAACAYAHFLQYGLSLKQRKEYAFENVDLGNVFHGVLELFADKLGGSGYTWFDFPAAAGEKMLDEAIEEYAVNYGETILYSSARNKYMLTRIRRILKRTVYTLQAQLKKGSFVPERFEMSFSKVEELASFNIALGGGEKMKLRGRIDRIDSCIEDDVVYVKVIDYKSGSKKFDLAALYYGLQLQLAVYMNAAVEMEKNEHPDKKIVPAAMLYYHIDDPMIEDGQKLTPDELNADILRRLKMTGLVNQDDRAVSLLDGEFDEKSDILPVERKKDGGYSAYSSVINEDDLKTVSDYVNIKIKALGRGIIDGEIAINPCEYNAGSACDYCAYRSVCGYDREIAGYEKRRLEKITKDEALAKMEEEVRRDRERE